MLAKFIMFYLHVAVKLKYAVTVETNIQLLLINAVYRIAGNFHELVNNMIFTEKTFVDYSLLPYQRTP